VTLNTGTRIGHDLSLKEIQGRHDLLFLGLGAQQGRPLNLPGENGPGVWVGTDFLARYNEGDPIFNGLRLLVVGGGNTALDVARAGRRLGAEVRILYHRERADMPAICSEIREALEEGVEIDCQLAPVEILRSKEGALSGLKLQRTHVGFVDSSGRKKPVPVPGEFLTMKADGVVIAVSQQADWHGLGALQPDTSKEQAEAPGRPTVELGGDVLSLGIASHAIAQGKIAAERACGEFNPVQLWPEYQSDSSLKLRPGHYTGAERHDSQESPVEYRLRFGKSEVSRTIDEADFLEEVSRCMSCGSCLGCNLCWMYCNAGSIKPAENPSPGNYFMFDPAVCEGCGKCIELCPCGFLSLE
jgi:formate dehydrogenase major subunit